MPKPKTAKSLSKNFRLGPAQRDIFLSAVISIGLVIGALSWVQKVEQPKSTAVQVLTITGNIAEHQRRVISAAIDTFSQRVNKLAESDLLQASAGNADNLASLQAVLALSFPEAVDSKLLQLGPLGIADEQTDTQRLRNNIEIDMLRKALETQALVIEGYKHQDRWLISFTRPVNARAAIFISFPASYFAEILKLLAGSTAHNELIHSYKSRTETILKTGEQPNSDYVQQRQLPIPGWSIAVYPSAAELHKYQPDNTLLWLFSLACIALLSASHCIFFLRSLHQQPPPRSKPNTAPPPEPQLKMEPSPLLPSFNDALDELANEDWLPEQAAAETETETGPAPVARDSKPTQADKAEDSHNSPAPGSGHSSPPAECFRAYDIRGIADTQLSDANCRLIARAIGSEARARGQQRVLLGRDGRLSSPRIRDAVIEGLRVSGIDVIDLGLVATPMLHYASKELGIGSAVMITGSHNPAHYNGMKISLDYQALSDGDIQALLSRIKQQDFTTGEGQLELESIEQRYIDRICSDVVIAQALKVVIDAGNGATSNIVAPLFEELGCEVVPLNCQIDGNFPSHPPDPTIEDNLAQLRETVLNEGADIGIALDGDGDRVAVVSGKGLCPRADQLLMILAEDVVSRNPGCEILFDIKSTRSLPELVLSKGGKPTMWKCGHSFMKRKMAATGALLGGEYSGHIFFKERWYGFDDGMYAAARLLEALSLAGKTLDEALDEHPPRPSTPEIIIPVTEDRKFEIVQRFAEQHPFEQAELVEIDGVRLETPSGWALIRASNTGPALSLRFEADSDKALNALRQGFKDVLAGIDPVAADSL